MKILLSSKRYHPTQYDLRHEHDKHRDYFKYSPCAQVNAKDIHNKRIQNIKHIISGRVPVIMRCNNKHKRRWYDVFLRYATLFAFKNIFFMSVQQHISHECGQDC